MRIDRFLPIRAWRTQSRSRRLPSRGLAGTWTRNYAHGCCDGPVEFPSRGHHAAHFDRHPVRPCAPCVRTWRLPGRPRAPVAEGRRMSRRNPGPEPTPPDTEPVSENVDSRGRPRDPERVDVNDEWELRYLGPGARLDGRPVAHGGARARRPGHAPAPVHAAALKGGLPALSDAGPPA